MKTLNHINFIILLAVIGLIFSCSGEWYANKAIKKGVSINEFQELASGGEEATDDDEDWTKVAPKGYIGLQDHGDDVWFKDIKIKEL